MPTSLVAILCQLYAEARWSYLKTTQTHADVNKTSAPLNFWQCELLVYFAVFVEWCLMMRLESVNSFCNFDHNYNASNICSVLM